MGTWGTNLYEDDFALDVKNFIEEQLRLGRTAYEIIINSQKELQIESYENDNESIFWCVLADVFWDIGFLDDETKSKALYWIDNGGDIENWKTASNDIIEKRISMFQQLKKKILTSQPPPKKLSKLRLYKCPWNVGDVFALCLTSKLSEERNLQGTFLLFQVSEKYLYPVTDDLTIGHLCPIVRAKLTFSRKTPVLSDFDEEGLILHDCPCKATNWKNIYATMLYTTSSRVVPKKLIYLGNKKVLVPNDDYGVHLNTFDICNNIFLVSWRNFEVSMIEHYYGHNLKEFSFYQDSDD